MKVIYIMGAGHIGSTILDIVLGSHSRLESLGEISKFHRFGWKLDENRRCACGASVYECPFWSQVRQAWARIIGADDVQRYLELQDRFERSRSGWMRLLRNTLAPSAEFAEYARCTEALYEAVRSVGRKPVLVDSSLTPRRAYALSRMPGIDLHLIHMVRDGRGIIWSLMKPGKKTMTKAYVPAPSSRTTRYWISANVQSLWVSRRVAMDRRKLIRYEDFVSDPAAAVTEIGAWVGEDLSALVDAHGAVATGNVRHTVAGNRVRMQKELVIRADFAWKELLPDKDRRTFWRMAGWLARRFGYRSERIPLT